MARRCQICEKGSLRARTIIKLRGKYNPTKIRRQNPNLQWTTLESGEKVKACARCIKTLHKTK